MDFNNIEFNNSEPIYLQIIDIVKKAIAKGDLKAGDKLPSVREMALTLGVNPNTLQRSYTELEVLGITIRKRGMGSFVNDEGIDIKEMKKNMGIELAEKFLKEMTDIGISKEEAIDIIKKI